MKRFFTIVMALFSLLLAGISVYADSSDGTVEIAGSSGYTPENRYSKDVPVSLTLSESYQVTIPASVSLTSQDGENYSCTKTISVSGVLGENRYVDVLISGDSILLSNGGSSIECSVTGENNKFFNRINNGEILIAKIKNQTNRDDNNSTYSNVLTYSASAGSMQNAGTYSGTQTFFIYAGNYN